MADVQQTSPDPELQALQAEWAPHWCIWRARRDDGKPGELVATRPRDVDGADRTIMRPTAEELDEVLRAMTSGAGR